MLSILLGLIIFPSAFMVAARGFGLCRTWRTTVPSLLVASCAMPLLMLLLTQSRGATGSPLLVAAVTALFCLVPASLAGALTKRA